MDITERFIKAVIMVKDTVLHLLPVYTMGTVYLLRHGQTMWNREEIFRGQTDVPLDDIGREQAKALAHALEEQEIEKPVFLASPLQRATETAQLAASLFPEAKVIPDNAFLDISYGEWEGKSRAEVEKEYPEMYYTWVSSPHQVDFPGGESLQVAADRAEEGIYRAALDNQDGDTVIVAHRAVNKALFCRLLGAGMKSFWKLRQNTACINKLYYSNSSFVLVKINETCHLKNISNPG